MIAHYAPNRLSFCILFYILFYYIDRMYLNPKRFYWNKKEVSISL